jgi:hypothetical protein
LEYNFPKVNSKIPPIALLRASGQLPREKRKIAASSSAIPAIIPRKAMGMPV